MLLKYPISGACVHHFSIVFRSEESINPSANTPSDVRKPLKTADCFNGAILENYMWSQTGTDVDVRVPVDSNIKGKDILVEIKDKYLKVALKNTSGECIHY